MRDHGREAQRLAGHLTLEDFSRNRVLSLAITRLLEIIGESATRVSLPTRERFPEIPWRSVTGMRNRLIHGYDSVDLAIVWQVVTGDIPDLLIVLDAAVAKMEHDNS